MIAPGFHPDMHFEHYLSLERLSPSGAKLLARSPAHYRHNRDNPPTETPALRIGKALHCLALEGRAAYAVAFAVEPKADGRTKEGKAIKAAFAESAEGKTIIAASEAEIVEGMAAGILAHPLAPALLADGTPELSMVWTDPESGAECKGRADLARLADGCLLDLKTALSAAPGDFARSVLAYGYHCQAAAYESGCKALGEEIRDFLFVVVEKAPPYLAAVYRLPYSFLELGRRQWAAACRTYAECREKDAWPGYAPGITELDLPRWAWTDAPDDSTDEPTSEQSE